MGFSLCCNPLKWRRDLTDWRRASSRHQSTSTLSCLSSNVDDDCPICHEQVGKPHDDHGHTESWLYFPCGHRFGSLCLYHWILDGQFEGQCPLCRRNVHASCGHYFVPQPAMTPRQVVWYATSTPHDRPVIDMCAFCIHRASNVAEDDPRKAPKWQTGLYFLEQANARRSPLTPGEWMADARNDRLWRLWYELKLGSVVWPPKSGLLNRWVKQPAREVIDDFIDEEAILQPKRRRRRLQRARR